MVLRPRLNRSSCVWGLMLAVLASAGCEPSNKGDGAPHASPTSPTSSYGAAPKVTKPNGSNTVRPAVSTSVEACDSDMCIVAGFVEAFNKRDLVSMNRFVDPNVGVLLIHQPGVEKKAERFERFDELLKVKTGLDPFRARLDVPVSGPLPTIYRDCKAFEEVDPNTLVTTLAQANGEVSLLEWVGGGRVHYRDASVRRAAQELSGRLAYYLYDAGWMLGFYFVRVPSGKLLVVAMDQVAPCSA